MAERKPPKSKGVARADGLPSRTRTRGKAIPALKSTAERVSYIAERMSRWDWPGDGAGFAERSRIAAVWGVSESRVKQLAAEASRSLRVDPATLDMLKAQHAAFAGFVMREAISRKSKVSGLPDFKAALEANRDAAKFAGIELEPKDADGADGVALRVVLTDETTPTPAPEGAETKPEAGGATNPA